MSDLRGLAERECLPGRKDDLGKEPWHLMPWDALHEVMKVLSYGAKKYAPHNWRKVEPLQERYFDAAMRHLIAHHESDKFDKESGLLHIAHATACLLFMLSHESFNQYQISKSNKE